MEVYNIENGNGPWDIASASQDGKDWAYHWAIWKDVDADGLLDVITARYRYLGLHYVLNHFVSQ